MEFTTVVEKNQQIIKDLLPAKDVVFSPFKIGNKSALVVYIDSLCEKEIVGELVLAPLLKLTGRITLQKLIDSVCCPTASVVPTAEEAVSDIINGSVIVFCNGLKAGFKVDMLKYTSRAVSEPPTAAVVKGPREGFTENLKTNLGLLRRRIKSENLMIEKIVVGRYTKTDVNVIYINTIADDKVVKKVINRIKKIDIDGVIDSSYVAKFIVEHKFSILKQVGNTEKPDVLTAKLLEGRVGIMVDGSPIVITVPYMLVEDFQSGEDYFQNNYRSNMQRVIRFTSIVVAICLPAVFVSAQLFHLQIIPLNFLLTIVNSIKGIPLSPSFEMFFTLLIFEILNEASIRMPKYVGMALSIVGALVLGDTAVRAGIVSTPTIMIMALSGISLYTVPELVDSMSFLRLVYLIVAGSIGGYGLILLSCLLIVYLASLENFDVPVLAPFAPLTTEDFKDSVLMTFLRDMKKRPKTLKPKDVVRIKNDIK